MDDSAPTLSAARTPLQSRGQARFETVLDAARTLLAEQGFAGFSIPALAERLGFTRASIYNFFPTPFSVLNELARRELLALEERLQALGERGTQPWTEQIRRTVREVARFYREHPVAQLLILGGPLTDESYRAQALTIEHLGGLSQRLFEAAGVKLPQKPVDVMVLAVEIGTTCLRHSVYRHGKIAPAYVEEAAEAMIRYLTPYVERVLAQRRHD
ncbi:MAG: TetR/AcrR family transcriptional regulator [Sinimarinibacterium sp.]|jgi:AcrR family transcriptional regulator